jgi:hypothetical protein
LYSLELCPISGLCDAANFFTEGGRRVYFYSPIIVGTFCSDGAKNVIPVGAHAPCIGVNLSTIRRVMIGIETLEIKAIFEDFVEQHYWKKEGTDWIAIDGKTLKNTLTNYESNCQNVFINVSAFSSATKLISKSEGFESQESSENA